MTVGSSCMHNLDLGLVKKMPELSVTTRIYDLHDLHHMDEGGSCCFKKQTAQSS